MTALRQLMCCINVRKVDLPQANQSADIMIKEAVFFSFNCVVSL